MIMVLFIDFKRCLEEQKDLTVYQRHHGEQDFDSFDKNQHYCMESIWTKSTIFGKLETTSFTLAKGQSNRRHSVCLVGAYFSK